MVASRPPFHLDYRFSLKHLDDVSPSIHIPSSEILFQEGIDLFEKGASQNCAKSLWKSATKFKQATLANPSLGEAWHAWAVALDLIYTFSGRLDALQEAKKIISKAPPTAEVHWDAALIHLKLAEKSGEIDDLMKALENFEKSQGLKESTYFEFWNDWAKAYALLSERLDDMRPVIKAIATYKQAINLSLTNVDGWIGLARALKKLYKLTHEQDHYVQAHDCYAAATQLKQGAYDIWIERIAFVVESAILSQDNSKLRIAIDKCENSSFFITSPKLMAYWAVAVAFLGKKTGNIDLIYEAQKKINTLREEEDLDDPEIIRLFGMCLYAIAGYHEDLDLYYQSIEQFQESISIDRTEVLSWTWMGHAYTKVFEITEDIEDVEKALYFYSKSLQLRNDPHLYFEVASLLIQLGDSEHSPEPVLQAMSYLEYLLTQYKSIAFDHPEWFFQYGLAQSLLGDLKDEASLLHKAHESFVNVLMLNPTHPLIHHQLGLVYSHLGDAYEDTEYLYRSLHHFKLASKTLEENEHLLIDWGLAILSLSQLVHEEVLVKEAESKLLQAARLGSQTVFYQLACLYSLKESYDLSIFYLLKSHRSKNLPFIDELMEDEWLDNVRSTSQFQEFLALLNQK